MGTGIKQLYRYERDYDDVCYDEGYILENPRYKITLTIHGVVKETPCGYWIKKHPWQNYKPKLRFVLKGSLGKRFAYETKEAALDNFIRRTRKALAHSKSNVRNADGFLKAAIEFQKSTETNHTSHYEGS